RLVCVTVETTSNDIAQRDEIFLMLKSAPNYIDRPVHMSFMTAGIACENACRVTEQELLRAHEHRPVRGHGRGDKDSVNHETTGLTQVHHIARSSRPRLGDEQPFDRAPAERIDIEVERPDNRPGRLFLSDAQPALCPQ